MHFPPLFYCLEAIQFCGLSICNGIQQDPAKKVWKSVPFGNNHQRGDGLEFKACSVSWTAEGVGKVKVGDSGQSSC